ncbi:hypothetical protein FO519_006470 [Halicephalobus sp. NKZ332]|nr:hypothetical protein FO519_006470 [Halicephalobus sp. NKZ332]
MTDKIGKVSMSALDEATSGSSPYYGKPHGLHWITAALFIVADMAGGGVVAMPMAMLKAGTIGGPINIFVIALSFCYTAHLLGENWNIMCERWPVYREHCRKPYPEMAFRAMGAKCRWLTSATVNVMLFGVAIVYLLLSASIFSEISVGLFGLNISTCWMIPIISILLLPVTFCKSPADFQWAVVTAMVTTTISVILIFVGIMEDNEVCGPVSVIPDFKAASYILSWGTFMFSFGGHGVFPTIQHDMKDPKRFTNSAVLAFTIVFLLYIPITIFGFMTYGSSLQDSIISSIQSLWIQQTANFFIAIHCILTLTIVINPLNQEFEHKFKLPHGFGIQRVVWRSFMMFWIVFAALSFPEFGPILNLIGGTCVAMTSAIMPCLFNLYLQANTEYEIAKRDDDVEETVGLLELTRRVLSRTSRLKLTLNLFIIVIAVICGGVTTYSAIIEISGTNFGTPCYWPSDSIQVHKNATHCCGPNFDVSRFSDDPLFCSASRS